jgi:hypothetical protein
VARTDACSTPRAARQVAAVRPARGSRSTGAVAALRRHWAWPRGAAQGSLGATLVRLGLNRRVWCGESVRGVRGRVGAIGGVVRSMIRLSVRCDGHACSEADGTLGIFGRVCTPYMWLGVGQRALGACAGLRRTRRYAWECVDRFLWLYRIDLMEKRALEPNVAQVPLEHTWYVSLADSIICFLALERLESKPSGVR